MRRALLLLFLPSLAPLAGCFSTTVREYTYDIDVKNTTDRAVALELLQARNSTIKKLRADLAPGGSISNAYTVRGEAEYLEARLRPLDADETEPWYIFELPEGVVRSDIRSEQGRLMLAPRPKAPEPAYQP